MEFTFGIITRGEDSSHLQNQVESILKEKIENFEIIIVGDTQLTDSENVKIINFDSSITKKKNLITESAKYENIVYLHDYIFLNDGWYEGQLKSGNNFEVRMDKIININGERYRDWCLWTGDNENLHSIVKTKAILPYDVDYLTNHQYISGAYWIAKKNLMQNFPLNEELNWGEGEDVEWSLRVRKHVKFNMNQNSEVRLRKFKDKVFDFVDETLITKIKENYDKINNI